MGLKKGGTRRVKVFSLSHYLEMTLKRLEYYCDENGVVIAKVPGASGFFAQGDSLEDARENLRDAIEGNVLLALQLGFKIPKLEGVEIEEENVETETTQN